MPEQKNLIDRLGDFLAEQLRRAQRGLERILRGERPGVTETLEASSCHIWIYKGYSQGEITVTITEILNKIEPDLQGVRSYEKERHGNKFVLHGEIEKGQNVTLKICCLGKQECQYSIDRSSSSDFRDKKVEKLEL